MIRYSVRRLSRRLRLPRLLLAIVVPAGIRAEWNVGPGRLTAEATATTTYQSNADARRGGGDALYVSLSPVLEFERRGAWLETRALAGVEFEHTVSGPGTDRDARRAGVNLGTVKSANPRFAPSLRTLFTESYISDLNVNARIFTRQTATAAAAEITVSPELTATLSSTYETNRAEGFTSRHSFENRGRLDSSLGGRRTLFAEVSHRVIASDGAAGGTAALDQRALNTAVGFTQGFGTATRASLGFGYLDQRRSAGETRQNSRGSSGTSVLASLEGPFLPPSLFPKLTSQLRVAYSRLENPGLLDTGDKQLTGELVVGWAARAATRLGLAAGRTRNLTVSDLTVETTHTHILVDQAVGRQTVLTATAGYEWMTVRGLVRHSEGAIATLLATRKLGSRGRWEGSFNYSYRDLNSSEQIANFAQHTGRLSTTYRF